MVFSYLNSHLSSLSWLLALLWVGTKLTACSTWQVTVSKDDTIILDGGGDKAIIEDRTEQVVYLGHNHILDIFHVEAAQFYFLGSSWDVLQYQGL